MTTVNGPHHGQQVFAAGLSIEDANAAMIMVHGRGATGRDILTLVPELNQPDFAYLAPQAAGNIWYPNSFMAPIPDNEPGISSGLAAISAMLAQLGRAGIPPQRTMLLGFSQGACLTLEFAARHAQRFGGVAGLSGGLIGPDGTPRDYPASLDGTPVFLGCSDADFHIPRQRVHHTTEVLTGLGADVTERLYPDMGHTIIPDEVAFVQGLMARMLEK